MSTPQAPAAAPATGGVQQEESGFHKFSGFAQQIFSFWAITQVGMQKKFLLSGFIFTDWAVATKFFAPKTAGPDTAVSTGGKPVVNTQPVNPWSQPPTHASLAWPLGETYSMQVLETNDHRSVEYTIDFPEVVKNNGSLWAVIYLLRKGATLDLSSTVFDTENIHYVRKLLMPYFPRAKTRKEKNLLSGEAAVEEEAEEADVIVPHWHSNVTLALISDPAVLPYSLLLPPILEHIHLIPNARDETGTKGFYKPIIFPNEFWHLRSHYVEVNSTTKALPVQVVFQPMSYIKFQLFATMTQGFKDAEKQQGSAANAEIDEVKRMLLETNPWFLGLTGLVSVPHVLFEMLAFKSDVSHWRQKKEMVGVSVRYDKLAFRYVSYAAIPLLAVYTVYSLIYSTHKGWYSFVISTLTSFVYMFRFAQLVPQLIINYKLKSVAHMPMKSMIFKILSTVVDDLFAYVPNAQDPVLDTDARASAVLQVGAWDSEWRLGNDARMSRPPSFDLSLESSGPDARDNGRHGWVDLCERIGDVNSLGRGCGLVREVDKTDMMLDSRGMAYLDIDSIPSSDVHDAHFPSLPSTTPSISIIAAQEFSQYLSSYDVSLISDDSSIDDSTDFSSSSTAFSLPMGVGLGILGLTRKEGGDPFDSLGLVHVNRSSRDPSSDGEISHTILREAALMFLQPSICFEMDDSRDSEPEKTKPVDMPSRPHRSLTLKGGYGSNCMKDTRRRASLWNKENQQRWFWRGERLNRQPLLATYRSLPSLPLRSSRSALDLNTEAVDSGNTLVDHEVTADYAQEMFVGIQGGSPVRADGLTIERRDSVDWQRGIAEHFFYQPERVIFETRMWVGTSIKVVCGCSDGTSSSLAAGQNRPEQ
ncbi:uncharacterized protein ARMOST_17393 [Armillaria ostoyae]|uniref:Cleft lip and palate transmembrane protein 1 (CLPTM1) n=1 Tax=Armillaria ostoyae TaxID=47428 RepID=A0A284RYU9_ARMOS|nr:uncharacterized protein ARMOST_17393 [Armillaria ostoyae]